LRKDLDLGLSLGTEMGVPMPVTAAAREVLQSHFGAAQLKPDPEKYLAGDFAALLETMAIGAGPQAQEREQAGADGIGIAVTLRCEPHLRRASKDDGEALASVAVLRGPTLPGASG